MHSRICQEIDQIMMALRAFFTNFKEGSTVTVEYVAQRYFNSGKSKCTSTCPSTVDRRYEVGSCLVPSAVESLCVVGISNMVSK